MAVFEILFFILGIIYGYAGQGKEDLGALLRNGLFIGLVTGIVTAIVGAVCESRAFGTRRL